MKNALEINYVYVSPVLAIPTESRNIGGYIPTERRNIDYQYTN